MLARRVYVAFNGAHAVGFKSSTAPNSKPHEAFRLRCLPQNLIQVSQTATIPNPRSRQNAVVSLGLGSLKNA